MDLTVLINSRFCQSLKVKLEKSIALKGKQIPTRYRKICPLSAGGCGCWACRNTNDKALDKFGVDHLSIAICGWHFV